MGYLLLNYRNHQRDAGVIMPMLEQRWGDPSADSASLIRDACSSELHVCKAAPGELLTKICACLAARCRVCTLLHARAGGSAGHGAEVCLTLLACTLSIEHRPEPGPTAPLLRPPPVRPMYRHSGKPSGSPHSQWSCQRAAWRACPADGVLLAQSQWTRCWRRRQLRARRRRLPSRTCWPRCRSCLQTFQSLPGTILLHCVCSHPCLQP